MLLANHQHLLLLASGVSALDVVGEHSMERDEKISCVLEQPMKTVGLKNSWEEMLKLYRFQSDSVLITQETAMNASALFASLADYNGQTLDAASPVTHIVRD